MPRPSVQLVIVRNGYDNPRQQQEAFPAPRYDRRLIASAR
jgi:hypothetical protein